MKNERGVQDQPLEGRRFQDLTQEEILQLMPLLEDVDYPLMPPAERRRRQIIYQMAQRSVIEAKRRYGRPGIEY